MRGRKIYSIQSHEQVLEIWREQKLRNINVLHLDFHCDLRGLLINRKTQRAYRIWDRFPQLDEGNFLTHAVLEGVVGSIRWVHDEPGGRKDDLKTVKYQSDATALLHRLGRTIRRDQGIPINYRVMTREAWNDIQPNEVLDIDWDFFACQQYAVESIQQRIDNFLSKDFANIPDQTFVCYSPNYSHSTRQAYRGFVDQLARRFAAQIIDVPKPDPTRATSRIKSIGKPILEPARQLYHGACLALRRHGIY